MDPQTQPPKQYIQKKSSKKPSLETLNLPQFLSLDSREQIKQFVVEFIKPLSYKNKEELEELLKEALWKRYFVVEGEGEKGEKKFKENGIQMVMKDLEKINLGFKECQVSAPISDVFNLAYFALLAEGLETKNITKEQTLALWQQIPYKNLETYLDTLGLRELYSSQDSQKFTKTLISLLTDNKILQCCHYYTLYKPLPPFEQKLLVPKLLHTDQIFNPIMLALFRANPALKLKVIQQIDLAKAVIILEHLEQDPRTYQNVNKFILRKHYKSMMHQYDEWYIFEDKMSFNQQFIQWHCDEKDLSEPIKQSIRFRNGIQCKTDKELVPNPLYELDNFTSAQKILHKIPKHAKKQEQLKQQQAKDDPIYLQLIQYGIAQSQVHFIDNTKSPNFAHMVQTLLACQYIGFDAEYRCTSTKYEQLGVALIQMSTGKEIFLVDFIKLETEPQFVDFFRVLLGDERYVIVGHSVQSDIRYIERTMKVEALEGSVDISKLFKEKFPNQAQTSLAFMTHFMTGKHLSKYQQRSNWNRRPLKKTQGHYAALDAQVCLILFHMLKQQEVKLTSTKLKTKKPVESYLRKQNLTCREDQLYMLSQQRPKFVIDSMLKKLCTILRNLGIDAEFMANSNYELMQDIAKKQGRIVLTKDKKLLVKKAPAMPIYCIQEKGDSDLMLEEIKKQFNLNLSLFVPLSRCVKCNCSDLQVIEPEQALKFVNFEYEDTNIKQFWRCVKCKQIYWEGNQFKNAKKRFGDMSEV